MQKNAIAAAAASLFVAPFAFATPIPIVVPIDLGSQDVVYGSRPPMDLPAPNVQFQGQSIVFDFSFQNGEFIRLFTATKLFQMDAFFRINNAPLPTLNFAGSGYLTDSQGQIGPAVNLKALPVTVGIGVNEVEVGVDFLLRPLISNGVPADIYGIHLNLTLPDSPGFGFGDGPPGGVTFAANVFGIGPENIPRDIVPDGGRTALFLATTLGALISIRAWITSTEHAGSNRGKAP